MDGAVAEASAGVDGTRNGQSVGIIGEPAFLSKVVHPPGVGDRTYVAEATITVAGLCRSCTGFATTRGTARLSDQANCSTAAAQVIRGAVIRCAGDPPGR